MPDRSWPGIGESSEAFLRASPNNREDRIQLTLQAGFDDQTKKLALLDIRNSELEQQLNAARQFDAELRTRLASEKKARQSLEALLENERAEFRSALSRVEMKLEGTNSKLPMMEQILSHTREELRKRTDELTEAHRAAKDATIQKNAIERKVEGLLISTRI